MDNKKISLKEGLAVNYKAFKIYYKAFPKMFLSMGIYNIIAGITPYVAIYISAQLINAIVNGESGDIIWGWVYIALFSTAITSLLTAISLRWKNTHNKHGFNLTTDIYRSKRLDMDFAITDSQKVKDLRSQITQTDNYAGRGLSVIRVSMFDRGSIAIVNIICSIALTYSLFTSKVTNVQYEFLNSPIVAIAVIASIILITVLSGVSAMVAQKGVLKFDEEFKLGNRLSVYFMHSAFKEKYGKDMRIYNQQDICLDYNDKNTFFTKDGVLHKEIKGRRGVLLAVANGLTGVITGIIYAYVALKALGGAFGIGLVVQYVAAAVKFSSSFATIYRMVSYTRHNAHFLKTTLEYLESENTMYRGSLTT